MVNMSYMSQKTVIEKLDPDVRFRLSTYSPQFRDIERLVPLKLKKLMLDPYSLHMNNIHYASKPHIRAPNKICLSWTNCPAEAFEYLIKDFINNRTEPIVADKLSIHPKAFQFLDKITFKTKHLLLDSHLYEVLQKIPLDPSSLPLKSITLTWTTFPLESSIFQHASRVCIDRLEIKRDFLDLEALPQRDVHFLNLDNNTHIVLLCTTVMISHRLQKKFSFRIVKLDTKMFFVQYFNQFMGTPGNKERRNPQTRNTFYPYRVIRPLGKDLEIHYYYEKTEGYKNDILQSQGLGWNFVMEMLPKGTMAEELNKY